MAKINLYVFMITYLYCDKTDKTKLPKKI